MKAHAPPPPRAPQPAPRHIFRNADGGGTSVMEAKENMLRPTVDFKLTLPQGYQTSVTEEGSKALMDLLVELCSRYHLNPALHTLELLSPEGHSLGFKPNALLGSLNVACVLIKEKVLEDKVVRRPAPKVPEKTVRLLVNYHGSQKAVLRVNPLVSLQALIPVICDKCEFDPSHVLLLKDGISRQKLPLDKSLTELAIKELYVHDKSLVLQPKMASAPALNYSDSVCSSTTSLGKTEKKGFLGIFHFSRKKNKKTSVDMDECDDNFIQNTDTQSNGLSKVSTIPSTLGQSQSVINMSRMSPNAEIKKRQAPAPPKAPAATTGHNFESYQMEPGSESQQRKRKAPAPPPTPSSISPGSDDTSASAALTPDTTEISIQALPSKVAESIPASSTIVVMQTIKPVPMKTSTQPNPPTTNSPTPTSSATDSLTYQDSNSEVSNSLDDSDAEQDQAGSQYSTITSSSVSGSVQLEPITKSSGYRLEELEKSRGTAPKSNQEVNSASSSRSETESALSLKLDEAGNNRHSAIGITDQPAPPKPRRSPARDASQLVFPPSPSTPTLPSPPIVPTENNSPECPMEEEEAAPQSWLHSSGQKANAETPEEETVSLSSSSGSSSLPDQGYGASEGMAEGEDSGIVSSPTDTQPTSPDGSLSQEGNSRSGGERLLGPVRDNSSDSDEGCATWGSRHRHNGISPQVKSIRILDNYKDDPDLPAQLHQTLADCDADLADHKGVSSVKETPYTMSTNSNDVPVSVVDMDVPVTAIDEVLEDYEINKLENEAKSLTRIKSAGNKGSGLYQQPSTELQNKNNSACTAADSSKSCANTKQPFQPKHLGKLQVKMSVSDKKEDEIIETKIRAMGLTDTTSVKEDKQGTRSAVISYTDKQKHNKSTEIKPDPIKNNDQRKPLLPTASQNNSNSSQSKITHNVTSRFGMKTFTVVPPKPVIHADTEVSALTRTSGAIRIDDQGNLVKVGITRNKIGGTSEMGIDSNEESSYLGKAKAFWSSYPETQENTVPLSKGQMNKAKENKDSPRNTPFLISDTTWEKTNTESLQTTQGILYKPADRIQSELIIKEESKEQLKGIHVAREVKVESQTSVSNNILQLSMKPALSTPVLPDPKKDMSFLKPSRRTSSHYVASAINKHTQKTTAKPNTIPLNLDSSGSVKTQAIGFQRSGQSIQVSPHQSSDNKKNDSTYKPHPSGTKRSMSYPEYVSDSQRDFGESRPERGGFGHCVGSTKGRFNTLETAKNRHSQINLITNNDRDNIKHIRPSGTNPTQSSLPHPSALQPTASKTGFQTDTTDMTKAATHVTCDAKPQPSVTVSDSTDTSQAVTVFGPVKRFRPVICRSVEKETSLHSSLMEAIQTGAGKDRLKKISTSADTWTKKLSYVDEENERSALLAAIRGQSNSGRLKRTKSEAADELEKFRNDASEDESSADPPSSLSPPSVSSTSPSVFTLPPPPPPPLQQPPDPMVAPPLPPTFLPAGKPSTVAPPSANTAMNPALAREAMLEAIRSGSAAEKLKKVALPKKTVQVNGRLGTIQPTSSALPQQ